MLLSGPRKCSTLQVMKEEHQERDPVQRRVGCTAGIKKVQRHDNGIWPATLKVLAEGAFPYAALPWSMSSPGRALLFLKAAT